MTNGKLFVHVDEKEMEILLKKLIDDATNEGIDLVEDWDIDKLIKYKTDIERIAYLGDELISYTTNRHVGFEAENI